MFNGKRLLQLAQKGIEHRASPHIDSRRYTLDLPRSWIITVVPQGNEYIVERLGKYYKTLKPGVSYLRPIVDRIKYAYCTKEQCFEIPTQSGTTVDNVMVDLNGYIFLRVVDTYKASYNIDNPILNTINFAQTTMRNSIASLTLDKLFCERVKLNNEIVNFLNKEAAEWGIECKRYEIRDIAVSEIVRRSMDLQAEAERRKRKEILDSEAAAASEINRAGGLGKSHQIAADARKYSTVTQAQSEMEALEIKAKGLASHIRIVSQALEAENSGEKAVSLKLAEDYIEQFGKLAKKSNSLILTEDITNPGLLAGRATNIFSDIQTMKKRL